MKVGFVGLGNMGLPMALNLVRAGHEVRGFDLAAAAMKRLAAGGGHSAADQVEAVRGANAVITMLPAGRHVRQVLTGADGVLSRLSPSTLLIDSSTIDVKTARELAEAAAAHGLDMLDAPVSGGTGGAEAGTLTFMVGGSPAAFDRAKPLLEAMGRTIVHAGAAGAGQAAKICNNLILGISMAGVAEAFALAERLGLDKQALFDISSRSSGQCWSLTTYCPVPGPVPASPANRDWQAGFAVDLMLKDLSLATEAQTHAGAVALLGPVARDAYAKLASAGLGAKDFSVIARALMDGALGEAAP